MSLVGAFARTRAVKAASLRPVAADKVKWWAKKKANDGEVRKRLSGEYPSVFLPCWWRQGISHRLFASFVRRSHAICPCTKYTPLVPGWRRSQRRWLTELLLISCILVVLLSWLMQLLPTPLGHPKPRKFLIDTKEDDFVPFSVESPLCSRFRYTNFLAKTVFRTNYIIATQVLRFCVA